MEKLLGSNGYPVDNNGKGRRVYYPEKGCRSHIINTPGGDIESATCDQYEQYFCNVTFLMVPGGFRMGSGWVPA